MEGFIPLSHESSLLVGGSLQSFGGGRLTAQHLCDADRA